MVNIFITDKKSLTLLNAHPQNDQHAQTIVYGQKKMKTKTLVSGNACDEKNLHLGSQEFILNWTELNFHWIF